MTVTDPSIDPLEPLDPRDPPGPLDHALDTAAVLERLDVDHLHGLHEHQVAERRRRHGSNELAAAPKRPAWRAFTDQFRDSLVLILLGAAVVSLVVSREVKTPIVIAIVVLFNAGLGFVQEHRAEQSLEALRRMLVTRARVRRDGELVELDATELVPGDIVSIEAGDRVPADGRLIVTANLEVEEAALTGESLPTSKRSDTVLPTDAGLGDRTNSVFMNTTVTRGRGELVVTQTGMRTEIGRIAGLLRETAELPTPLQIQLNHLGHRLALLAGGILVLVFAIGLLRGESLSALFLTGVALAVASIPEGLPAVVAVTLAVGTYQLAREHAIVKRLASVETLGSTTVICSDKTGTLTLNQMTVTDVWAAGRRHEVSGTGYGLAGDIVPAPTGLDRQLAAMALCNDARVDDDGIVGDPTEAALLVAAVKGGLDPDAMRRDLPRAAEVPFDSATKLMATFHATRDEHGLEIVRVLVKGAPDVVLARSVALAGARGSASPLDDAGRDVVLHENDRLAGAGLRVLAVAERDLAMDVWSDFAASGGDPADLVMGLTFLGLAGIVDPPRPEARLAIAEARSAGMSVKMITGDHAATATAIGRKLGLGHDGEVRAVTGGRLEQMTDDELDAELDSIDVFARVSPEHKLRLVAALQRRGHVVAMTGDGVNDAPALKAADMGVAMGITGTEVTKEAATMVLTDDNFATIVRAVRQGRTIYDNIVKFVRFQLSTTLGFAFTFLAAGVAGIASGKPFTAIQVLWVNLLVDGPPAMALGIDPPASDIMERRPRPAAERILLPSRLAKLVFYAAIMGLGTLGVLAWGPGPEPVSGVASTAGTMAFTTFILFQCCNLLNARDEHRTIFRRDSLRNIRLWAALASVLVLQVLVVHWDPLQSLFDTVSLDTTQWAIAAAVASSIIWLEELRKLLARLVPLPFTAARHQSLHLEH